MKAVFVYGLLKPGFSLHYLVSPFVVRSAPGRVRGRLYDAGVPAVRFDEPGEIEGFVLWLDDRVDEALRILDDVEDEGDLYRRVSVEVTTSEGITEAWAYEYMGELAGKPDVGRIWK